MAIISLTLSAGFGLFPYKFSYYNNGYFALQPLLCALTVFGADRIMFAVDYPYSTNAAGRHLLDTAPLSLGDLAKIARQRHESGGAIG